MEPSPAAHLGSVRKSSFHRDVDSQTRLTSVPPSPLHLPRLEELDNAPQPQREEQWSTVSKNALPKTVAKTAAKAVVKDPSATVAAHATGHAFGALTKFMEADEDGDEDEDEDEPGEASAGAFNVSDFKVSRPFYHTFEDTGKGVWCCVVTSPSGFDSAPIPITATVKRAGKLKPNSPPPALVPEEEAQVVLDFKRRQKEERKKAAAEGGKKKKKKKKGAGAAAATDDIVSDGPTPLSDTSEVTVTQNPAPEVTGPEDKSRLTKEILHDLFAPARYRPPGADAVPDSAATSTGSGPRASDARHDSNAHHDARGGARGVPPGFVRLSPTRREEHVEPPPPHATERAAADSATIVAQMQAQMARMMQAQQGALISQQAAALEQAQAQMLAMQRQMAEMQRQLEETRAREAQPRGRARGEGRGARGEGRSAASNRDWRSDAPGPVGVDALEANGLDTNGLETGGGAGNGGVRPNPFRRAKQAPVASPPPGFEPKPRDPNAYVPPALRGAAREEQG